MEKEKSKLKSAAPASADNNTNNETAQFPENSKTNEKIDAWIKANPDRYRYFDELPHERAVRKLILNEVEKYERHQKRNEYNLQKLEKDPEAKKAYEILLSRVPEKDRERMAGFVASQVLRIGEPRGTRAEKSQAPKAGMKVAA